MNDSQTKVMALFEKAKSITHKKAQELTGLTQGQVAGAIHRLKLEGKLTQNDQKEYVKANAKPAI